MSNNEKRKVENMGFFDKLFNAGGRALGDAVSNAVGNAVSNQVDHAIDNAVNNAINGNNKTTQHTANQQENTSFPQNENNYSAGSNSVSDATCREKILKVLASDFPAFTVKENVSPQTLGGSGNFMNYSIGVYNGEIPKLFIMIVGKTTCSHREYRFSKQEAEKNGVPMINFVEHYPNEIDYISNRLFNYL